MNNCDIQSKEKDSPKTPGGISKFHLTSIRRLGLSRKWKKSGISPFVSPLASNSNTKPVDNEEPKTMSRKRKLRLNDENTELSPGDDHGEKEISEIATTPPASKEILPTNDSTPIRKASVTRKKSRTIPYKDEEITENVKTTLASLQDVNDLNVFSNNKDLEKKQTISNISPKQTDMARNDIQAEHTPIIAVGHSKLNKICNINCDKTELNTELPNKLVKECIVVIQNKILRKEKSNKTVESKPEVFFDSDTDDIPLIHINNIKLTEKNSDSDFKNTESKNTTKVQPIKKHKSTSSKKSESKKQKEKDAKENKQSNKSSQSSNSFNDEDDDDFEINKKTIFFPKSYEKLSKPLKAKSTGSITQKDIEELKARIEMKKQLLFAKAQSKDTEELRGLIKKWRKGCQDALMELLELMKNKLPDRSDMNYANILQMLKIPPSYVGYDPENDCFTTPDDNSILASIFSDL